MTRSHGSISSAEHMNAAANTVALGVARRACLALPLAIALLTFANSTHAADDAAQYLRSQGLAVYLGIVPAAMLKAHDPGHTESTMHGGASAGPHQHHLLVAVFEESSGLRIADAKVTATISGLGHVGGTHLQLEPMTIDDTVTYGNFFGFPGADLYTITVSVRRSGAPRPIVFEFSYDHRSR